MTPNLGFNGEKRTVMARGPVHSVHLGMGAHNRRFYCYCVRLQRLVGGVYDGRIRDELAAEDAEVRDVLE
jgi:hypothetical protein